MGRYLFYLAVALLAFGLGSVVFYAESNVDVNSVEVSSTKYEHWVKESIRQIELNNRGFDELLNFSDGDTVTVQGSFDAKFLCHDVTAWQPDVCTTVFIGNSNENKSLLVRLPVCNEQDKTNCIVWKPDNLCADNENCSSKIKIYDNNSIPTDLVEQIQLEGGGKSGYYKNIGLKVTGKISIVDGKYYLKNPVEKIEIINLEQK